MSNKKKSTAAKTEEEDPVDQLLQSAQDELLLKLSVDSHMSRVSPDYLLPDLDRRFQALKSRPTTTTTTTTTTTQSSIIISKSRPSKSKDDVDPDDLFARFAALKAPNNTISSSTVSGPGGFDQGGDEDEEDEVKKIIRWAKDSSRLDHSPPSDEDEDEDADADEDDDDKGGNVRVKGHHRK
ncbi:PREDICTED: transcription initiation factor TFIID subunit 11 isoform X3 [Populus euphratica]|uniref:Transcription initiation factor TFIID subunit 11 isoform X3 n=1 Tax=Populus euphratica TaxID=75702 RepID=A0AAJ6UKQ4_POPEU|nr:PREDICTED: transcription initiation factor TFIID subunit 11 isoform X3 [Populus euphratica]